MIKFCTNVVKVLRKCLKCLPVNCKYVFERQPKFGYNRGFFHYVIGPGFEIMPNQRFWAVARYHHHGNVFPFSRLVDQMKNLLSIEARHDNVQEEDILKRLGMV